MKLYLFQTLKHIYKSHWNEIRAKHDTSGYLRRIGVRFGENIKFYGSPIGMFGSEPWMVTLGDNVHITQGCLFITHDGGTLPLRKEVPDLEITKPIVIGNDVYLGVRTIILPGVTIGDRCIIGSGSIVTKDIPSNSVAAGIPAKVIKTTDEYLEKIKAESLHIGHLTKDEKIVALKEIFQITHI